MKIARHMLLTGVAMMAFTGTASAQNATPAATTPATAIESARTSDDTTEVVVTAQKRSQRLLDVPVAITAVSAEALTTQNLNRLQDYFDRVPGLQYSGQRVSSLSLRGVTTGGGATSPTVSILIDDVQFGGTTNAGQPPLPDFDASAIERVEVLRGPQGTLYGAASLGGLIKYVLRQPSTDSLSGRIEVGGTTVAHGGEGYALRGAINVPLSDWFAVTASGFKREDAPYLDNALNSTKDVNTRDTWGYRVAALARPTDNLKITVSALKQKVNAQYSDLQITSGGVPICVACTTGGTAATRSTAVTTFEPVYGDLTLNALNSPNRSRYELYTGRAEWEIGGATITSVSAWGIADNSITGDLTSTFSFLLPFYGSPTGAGVQLINADRTTKFSQEVRASGSIGKIDWLAGGFYTVEHAATNQTLSITNASGTVTATPFAALGPSRYRELATFADLTWHLTDRFEIQVGGRYAANRQTSMTSTVVEATAVPIFGSSSVQNSSSKDNVFTWLVTPTFHLTKDMMVYGRTATGYRPGGPNLASTGVGNYNPDRVTNYELGFKGRVVPGLLTIDASLFQIDWKDIQLQATATNQFTFITNGGRARSRGLEFAAGLTPWQGMSIDGNITFTDATLIDNLAAYGATLSGVRGDRLPFSAKGAGSVTAQQRFDLSSQLEGSFGVNYTHVGARYGAFNLVSATRPRILIPSYDTINLTAGITFDLDWSLTASLRNVFDTRGVAAADNRNGANVPRALFIQPRTLGLTLARNF